MGPTTKELIHKPKCNFVLNMGLLNNDWWFYFVPGIIHVEAVKAVRRPPKEAKNTTCDVIDCSLLQNLKYISNNFEAKIKPQVNVLQNGIGSWRTDIHNKTLLLWKQTLILQMDCQIYGIYILLQF